MASKDSAIRLLVVLGSTRPGRLGDRVCKFLLRHLASPSFALQQQFQVDYLDLAQANLGLLKIPHHWMPEGSAPADLEALATRVRAADAYLFVSPEYNRSMSPALVNFVDHFGPAAYSYKPSAIAAYSMGPFAGFNSASHLRLLLSHGVGCATIRGQFAAPEAHKSLDETGKELGETGKLLVAQADKLFAELEWTARALKLHRARVEPPPQV